MNRSELIHKSGKRYKQFKKICAIMLCGAFSVLLLSCLGYSAVSAKYGNLENIENYEFETSDEASVEILPDQDEPVLGEDEMNDPIYQEFDYYENEYPTGLKIYDDIFLNQNQASDIPKGELRIVSTDLSKNPTLGTVFLKNNTPYTVNALDFLNIDKISLPTAFPIGGNETAPKVLIIHTHGTEAYAEEGRVSYKKSELPRSTDITKNVVAVGKVISNVLNQNGIPTVHCEIMHDEKSYNNSYTYSNQTVLEYLQKYPSIEYVFDIHRDALLDESNVYKVITYDESTPTAQIMLVVGTDSAGAAHPDWRENLSFAVDLQYLLTKRLENIVRPICLKNASFNQQYCDRAILIEVGTCVNTLQEAKHSAEILGQTLSTLIKAEKGF